MILYISNNDGSDMRINKEIKSLSSSFDVIFIGVGNGENCFIREYCKDVILIKGKRKSVLTILKLIYAVTMQLMYKKISGIHIVNEQLMVFFYPFLFFRHTVLDIFDSVFLRINKPGNKLVLLKRLVYLPANRIIVTDENRLNLMPEKIRQKCFVVPNYPYFLSGDLKKTESPLLRILYYGWLGLHRGTEIAEGLAKTGLPVKITMAGWFSDEYTRNMSQKYPGIVEYLGVLPQSETHRMASVDMDYILCLYDPVNENNINASPNKIFDAIQTETPVLINSEVKISSFVKENKTGIVIPSYSVNNFAELFSLLFSKRGSFVFNKQDKERYAWESIEQTLIELHSVG